MENFKERAKQEQLLAAQREVDNLRARVQKLKGQPDKEKEARVYETSLQSAPIRLRRFGGR